MNRGETERLSHPIQKGHFSPSQWPPLRSSKVGVLLWLTPNLSVFLLSGILQVSRKGQALWTGRRVPRKPWDAAIFQHTLNDFNSLDNRCSRASKYSSTSACLQLNWIIYSGISKENNCSFKSWGFWVFIFPQLRTFFPLTFENTFFLSNWVDRTRSKQAPPSDFCLHLFVPLETCLWNCVRCSALPPREQMNVDSDFWVGVACASHN